MRYALPFVAALTIIVTVNVPRVAVASQPTQPVVVQCDTGTVVWNGNVIKKPLLAASDSMFSINGRVYKRASGLVRKGLPAEALAIRQRLCDQGASLVERQHALAEFYRNQTELVQSVVESDGRVQVTFRHHPNRPMPVRCDCPGPNVRSDLSGTMHWFRTYLRKGGMVIIADGQPEVYVQALKVPTALIMIERLGRENVPQAELEAAGLSNLSLFKDVIRRPKALPEVRGE